MMKIYKKGYKRKIKFFIWYDLYDDKLTDDKLIEIICSKFYIFRFDNNYDNRKVKESENWCL